MRWPEARETLKLDGAREWPLGFEIEDAQVTTGGESEAQGIDAQAVEAWLTDRVPDLNRPVRVETIRGGRSNLTFIISEASGRRWVLRRPPLHSVLPSAHDVSREHTVMTALHETAVPVPEMVGYEPDPTVGVPFFVMSYVDGHIVRDDSAARAALNEGQRRTAGESLVDVLADLHAVDPDLVGLGSFAKKDDYIARQLRVLRRQLHRGQQQYSARALPVFEELHNRLLDTIPHQDSASIVHGDYRLDNVVIGHDGTVQAVLDWELSTLGDPLADVGMLAIFWPDTPEEVVPRVATQTVAEGFPLRAEAITRYAERAGRNLSQLDYYQAFACWKLSISLSARLGSV